MLSQTNAVITIATANPEPTGWDEVTGQPIFSPGNTIQLKAFLENKKEPQEKHLPGVDNPIAYLEGRIETTIPELKIRQFYPITINLQNQIYNARFYLLGTTLGGFGLESYFGTAIAGYLLE
jgi:hypothetical protein